ncbi:helix-turn-helix domain-containing protein [Actinoallomurus rhizosphaericola]|uniref:helix-turn-helix domain-containing protein n=1 Tax=Actinoallomurus rhizosphaericola TaxID=2952536 RepID=UPI002093C98C|nr:transcriptional regulator [Actinoallomurus rhizosphaericola]MCO5999806.1 helix-turn-helix domain-containing protein [Actinoallomurus rhizosphaericola]
MPESKVDSVGADLTFGERVKLLRSRRGLTREVLGALIGKSGSWVKAIETGRLQQPKLPVLLRLAEALRVRDIAELTGDQSMPVHQFAGPGHPALPAVRDALNALVLPDAPPPPLNHLRARIDAAWRARHAAPDHRTVLGRLLPDLIKDTQHAVRLYESDDRRRAWAMLADVYNLAQFFLAYQPAADLLWRVAERAMVAAQEADAPGAIGGAAWLLVEAHRDAGDFEIAEGVNQQALDLIRPYMGNADHHLRARWGALLFAYAYTAARAGENGTAWRMWDEANDVAQRLPWDYYDPMTSFSRAVMGAHAVTTAVELRQGGESRQQARRAAHLMIPSQPRRGRHLIEVARAYHLNNDKRSALGSLNEAYVAAPETIRYNGHARRILLEFTTEGPRELRREANDLADRVGLLV